MKFSIITVCLNSENTIEQTVQSVIEQENCDYEYIIVDGMSTDKTLEIIRRYEDRISIIISEPDTGLYDAMNKGISLATGDVIGIINSDDWYEAGALALVEKCFESSDVEVIYGKMNLIYLNGESKVMVPGDMENIRYEMGIPHSTVFIKKDIYRKYGAFKLKYRIAADYELMLRLYTKGVKFRYLENILASFRLGGLSFQQTEACKNEEEAISLRYLPCAPLEKRQHIKNIISHKRKVYLFEKLLNDSPDMLCEILLNELGVNFEDDIVIFGAGNWGRKLYRILLLNGKRVSFFVDNDVCKHNQTEAGVKVLNPEVLKSFRGILLAAVEKFSDEISLQIDRLNNPSLYCIYWEEISVKHYGQRYGQ